MHALYMCMCIVLYCVYVIPSYTLHGVPRYIHMHHVNGIILHVYAISVGYL